MRQKTKPVFESLSPCLRVNRLIKESLKPQLHANFPLAKSCVLNQNSAQAYYPDNSKSYTKESGKKTSERKNPSLFKSQKLKKVMPLGNNNLMVKDNFNGNSETKTPKYSSETSDITNYISPENMIKLKNENLPTPHRIVT